MPRGAPLGAHWMGIFAHCALPRAQHKPFASRLLATLLTSTLAVCRKSGMARSPLCVSHPLASSFRIL